MSVLDIRAGLTGAPEAVLVSQHPLSLCVLVSPEVESCEKERVRRVGVKQSFVTNQEKIFPELLINFDITRRVFI